MIVYLDLYFFANLLIDWLLLTAVCCRYPARRFRRLIASLTGTLLACLSLLTLPADWLRLLMCLPTAALILYIAHTPSSWENFLRDLFYLFSCSFFFSGLLPFLLSWLRLWLLCVSVTYLALRSFLYFCSRRRRQVLLTVIAQDHSWNIPALIDSGNTLRDPVTGLPVIVVRSSCLPSHPPGTFPVPYHTVGSRGILLAFRPDRLLIDGESISDVLIAPTSDFSQSSSCLALVPSALENSVFPLS